MAPFDLSPAEQSLWNAFPGGKWVDLQVASPGEDGLSGAGSWGQGRSIRAEVIAALLLGAAPSEPGRSPAVRLRGARITGRLDVMGATVGCAFVCERCCFDEAPRFVEATTKTVRIVDSRLPAFNGARMRLDGICSLWGSTVSEILILDRARITGELCLREAVIGDGRRDAAFAADGLVIDGDMDCARMRCQGPMLLRGARISGSLHAARASISRPGDEALNADHAVIGGTFDGQQLVIEGKPGCGTPTSGGTSG